MSIWMFGTLRRLDEEDEGELQQREDRDVVKMSQITTGHRSPLVVVVQVVVVVAGKTDLIGVDSFTDGSWSRSEDFMQMTDQEHSFSFLPKSFQGPTDSDST